MVLTKYLQEEKRANNVVATIQHELMKSYLEAEETTKRGENLDLSVLKNERDRKRFSDKLYSDLFEKAKNYLGAGDTNDIFKKNAILKSYSGLTEFSIRKVTDGLKESMNHQNFFKSLEEPINGSLETILSSPITNLKSSDNQDAIIYTNTIGRVDPKRLSKVEDIAKLLYEFKTNGVIRPTFLEDQPYKI